MTSVERVHGGEAVTATEAEVDQLRRERDEARAEVARLRAVAMAMGGDQ